MSQNTFFFGGGDSCCFPFMNELGFQNFIFFIFMGLKKGFQFAFKTVTIKSLDICVDENSTTLELFFFKQVSYS